MTMSAFQLLTTTLALAMMALPVASPAVAAEEIVIYASPDGMPGYDGTEVQDPQRRTLEKALSEAARFPNNPVTVQLLTKEPLQPTTYRADPKKICHFAISNATRSQDNRLRIRGVRVPGDEADTYRWLTQIAGTSVNDIINHKGLCKAKSQLLASDVATPSEGDVVHADDLLKAMALIEASIFRSQLPGESDAVPTEAPLKGPAEAPEGQSKEAPGKAPMAEIAAAEDQSSLTRCFHVTKSSWIEFENLHFKDCWLPAIYTADSKNIALKGSFIEGSSYAVFAYVTPTWNKKDRRWVTDPNGSSGFVIKDNIWFQDTSGFGPGRKPECRELNVKESCPGAMWSSIPWGVTHDTLNEHMNGALFGAINIAGDVTIQGNVIRYAYNGIRMITDDVCEPGSNCFSNANKNVTVSANTFAYIRDNPVEPEGRAQNWRIHGNDIHNAHGWFSLDNVRDGPIYIWGNIGWWNERPAEWCDDNDPITGEPKWLERKKVNFERGGWRWLDKDDKTESLECKASRRGTVIKIGDAEEQKEKQIYVFHNSWRLRAPLISDGKTGTIHHWNNAIQFTGCDPDSTAQCPAALDPHCDEGTSDYLTPGDRSVAFACVDKAQVGDTASYDFHNDISSQGFPPDLSKEPPLPPGKDGFNLNFGDPKRGDFTIKDGSDAIGAGCRVVAQDDGVLTCDPVAGGEPRVDVGAFSANGRRYDGPAMLE